MFMNQTRIAFLLILCSLGGFAQTRKTVPAVASFHNTWTKPLVSTPSNNKVDAPLMGNGDVTMSVGRKGDVLSYYLSKNDFWRLVSPANFNRNDDVSGPRTVGSVNIQIEGFGNASFTADQRLIDGATTCSLTSEGRKAEVRSWVSATENLIFIEINAFGKVADVTVGLTAPDNKQSKLATGTEGNALWLTRVFVDSVDIPTEVAVALRTIDRDRNTFTVAPGTKVTLTLAVESKFKQQEPLKYVLAQIKNVDKTTAGKQMAKHDAWWRAYWEKSSVSVEDTVLMKAYYQGLYTMAACSRDAKFPPGIFGWVTTDNPQWAGDYHLNYNHQAPFYSLYTANRLEQGIPHDAPLIDFIPRGEWYAKNVTKTRGVLYPVGIGPLGIEVTRNHPRHNNPKEEEQGGLFFGQRSNAAYGLLNIAQYWRCTYDEAYGKKIYPYALAVANFWEDYLTYEDGRYVIYNDAVHEGSGGNKNAILSLGLVRNTFGLMLDLSATLKTDQDRQAKWRDILDKLSHFPVQERNGKKVFRYTEKGVDWWVNNGLGIQHIYPANAITLDSGDELLTLSRNTIDDMKRFQDNNTSSSFFMAAIRVGYDPALVFNELRKYALHTYPNGFQLNNPHGIENSCTVTNALDEMLCMSAGNVIRIFAGLPAGQNAEFDNLRAWGAFLVSARLTKGNVSDVRVKSEKGKVCTIVNPWPGKSVRVMRNGKRAESVSGPRFSLDTKAGELIQLQAE
jgi:alpha-L-fucosidase 2